MRNLIVAAVIGFVGPVAAGAQGTDLGAPSHLMATQTTGCISADHIWAMLATTDFSLGGRACPQKGNFDNAMPPHILMQLRARFDTLWVADPMVHQAEQVFASGISDGLAAFGRFGETGSSGYSAVCNVAQQIGLPKYPPSYMIAYGMAAVAGGGNGLVTVFKLAPALSGLPGEDLKCAKT